MGRVRTWATNVYNAIIGRNVTTEETYQPLDATGQLDAYRWYYENNALYKRLSTALRGTPGAPALDGIRPLENPAHKTVEFYSAKLIPAELLETVDAPEKLKDQIEKIWKWSNWHQRRRVASRWLSMYGNLYIKIASSEDESRVYFQLIDPRYVTYFETDERDYFTYLRLDTPQERRSDDDKELETYTVTEVWDKENETYRVWEHDEGQGAELDKIIRVGKLVESQVLAERSPRTSNPTDQRRYTGFDFIPVVHSKFRDIGADLGLSSYAHCIEAIDQLNLMLTRLDNMLFPKIHLALKAQAMTPEGRPIDAPVVDSSLAETSTEGEVDTVDVKGTVMWRLPGMTELDSVVPAIDFASHIEAIDKALERLEKMLPELSYYRLRDMQEISGRAARILLGDILDRVEEARDNLFAGLIRADEMALTIAKVMKLEGFDSVGDYKTGALEHTFDPPDVFPISELEEAETDKAELANLTEGIANFRAVGLDVTPLKEKLAELFDIEVSELQDVPPEDVEAEVAGQAPEVEALMNRLSVTGGNNNGRDGEVPRRGGAGGVQ
jgi:hypothetical protein